MLKLLHYFKPYWWALILLVLCVFGQTYANLSLPDYAARIINEGIIGFDRNSIYRNGLAMLVYSLIGGVFLVATGYIASRLATSFTMRIRSDAFTKVEQFSLQEFNRFSTASLITRCTNDLQQIQMVMVMLLRMALMAPVMGAWAIYKAWRLAPSMTWIMAVAVAALLVVIAVLFTFALPRFRLLQKLVDRLNLTTREMLTGIRVIRAFNKEAYQEEKFSRVNTELVDVNLFVNRLLAVMQPIMFLILNLTSVAIVWIGAPRIDAGSLQIGNMLAFMQYAMQAIFAFLMISIVFIMAPRAFVSANRVVEILETDISIKDPVQPTAPRTDQIGTLVFENVTFAYPGADRPAIQDISFTALAGQTTALIGSTGSGKSTLLNLIPRFYDVSSGRILIDGIDVREMNLDDLYARIGYVPQRTMLFSGTVASNIRYGSPDSSDLEMKRSARIAQADDFIEALADQYEHPVAQGGGNVSGGQKQRLSIARAIARNPQIYLFDDSFSALDFKTESLLRAALREITRESIVIVVAQRVSAIMHADNIIVLEAGRMVGQGTHQSLLKTNAIYQEIAASQLSEQELAEGASPTPDVPEDLA